MIRSASNVPSERDKRTERAEEQQQALEKLERVSDMWKKGIPTNRRSHTFAVRRKSP